MSHEHREVPDGLTSARDVEHIPAVAPETSFREAEALMRVERQEMLPVADGSQLVGLLHRTRFVLK